MRVLRKLLGLLIGVPIILFGVLFAVESDAPVVLGLYPFDMQVTISLVLALFITLLTGFVLGAVAEFLRGGRKRQALRAANFKIRTLEVDLAKAQRDAKQATEAAAALPKKDGPPQIAA